MLAKAILGLAVPLILVACTSADFGSRGDSLGQRVKESGPNKGRTGTGDDPEGSGGRGGKGGGKDGGNDAGDGADGNLDDDTDRGGRGGADSDEDGADEGGVDSDSDTGNNGAGTDDDEISKSVAECNPRIGINFEDDKDFNFLDFQWCFCGAFEVNGREIKSKTKQTILAKTAVSANCVQQTEFVVTHPDGETEKVSEVYRSGDMKALRFKFKKGSIITMSDTPAELDPGNKCQMNGQKILLSDSNRARITIGTCTFDPATVQ